MYHTYSYRQSRILLRTIQRSTAHSSQSVVHLLERWRGFPDVAERGGKHVNSLSRQVEYEGPQGALVRTRLALRVTQRQTRFHPWGTRIFPLNPSFFSPVRTENDLPQQGRRIASDLPFRPRAEQAPSKPQLMSDLS